MQINTCTGYKSGRNCENGCPCGFSIEIFIDTCNANAPEFAEGNAANRSIGFICNLAVLRIKTD